MTTLESSSLSGWERDGVSNSNPSEGIDVQHHSMSKRSKRVEAAERLRATKIPSASGKGSISRTEFLGWAHKRSPSEPYTPRFVSKLKPKKETIREMADRLYKES